MLEGQYLSFYLGQLDSVSVSLGPCARDRKLAPQLPCLLTEAASDTGVTPAVSSDQGVYSKSPSIILTSRLGLWLWPSCSPSGLAPGPPLASPLSHWGGDGLHKEAIRVKIDF